MAVPKLKQADKPLTNYPPEVASPTAIRRMIDEAKRRADNPLFGTEAGRLLLVGQLNTTHVAAAQIFARLSRSYRREKKLPAQRFFDGVDLETNDIEDEGVISALARNGGDVGALAEMNEQVRRVVTASRNYNRAVDVLKAKGNLVRRAVFDVVVYDEVVVVGQREPLRIGLNALAIHFGISQRS